MVLAVWAAALVGAVVLVAWAVALVDKTLVTLAHEPQHGISYSLPLARLGQLQHRYHWSESYASQAPSSVNSSYSALLLSLSRKGPTSYALRQTGEAIAVRSTSPDGQRRTGADSSRRLR